MWISGPTKYCKVWSFLLPTDLTLLLLCLTLCDVNRLSPTLLGKKDLVSISVLQQHNSLHTWHKKFLPAFQIYIWHHAEAIQLWTDRGEQRLLYLKIPIAMSVNCNHLGHELWFTVVLMGLE